MGEGGQSDPRVPTGEQMPLVMVPTSAGAGASANGRCLVWHPDDEVLVPIAAAPGERDCLSVSYISSALEYEVLAVFGMECLLNFFLSCGRSCAVCCKSGDGTCAICGVSDAREYIRLPKAFMPACLI